MYSRNPAVLLFFFLLVPLLPVASSSSLHHFYSWTGHSLRFFARFGGLVVRWASP
jgi:hypothetical protein